MASSRQRPAAAAAASGIAPDAAASYTRKGGGTFYGYTAPVASDGAHQLIRAAVITAAKTDDGEVLPQIAPADTRAVYADKA